MFDAFRPYGPLVCGFASMLTAGYTFGMGCDYLSEWQLANDLKRYAEARNKYELQQLRAMPTSCAVKQEEEEEEEEEDSDFEYEQINIGPVIIVLDANKQ
jgi:hypothetical protein